ncbi:DUF2313 domain-containing protein [Salmonella enterica subsp. enterica serovar Abaetetuba]|uniref:DUF2313 domain-containing protein n=2 Tax=Salmonella enterica TaxID=28901 RepID=A0A3F3IRV5_SALER|nr:putative phage tail protein [Salmonella enterica]EAC2150445.1 DUF2313 domain-containing protein [Salmonella enterica subsp. enterica]EAN3269556.1 DUF2313 domain-containing protein [Salmonella enterica subsp. enterica serovar Oranienburg]EAP4168928.1 DUF2313 domain-containing protein [Salmonella enterica subsp. enterica serovar Minnesota]EAR0437062.1 DUF2313 domain-containing protein [Salmonella enterica subsp. enterica serovar Poona]EBO8546207.1 DUF2313 domain-containing protein [Salmonella
MGVITPHQRALLQLLPRGKAWNKAPDSTLSELCRALSEPTARVNETATQLLRERFPSQAVLLLEDWEKFLGLPDCTSGEDNIETRQMAAGAKHRMWPSLNVLFYKKLAKRYGYDIEITPDPDNQYISLINVKGGVKWRNATVLDNCLTPLRVYDSGILECLLEKYKPAHQEFRFIYSE